MPVLSVEDLDKIEKDLVAKFDQLDRMGHTPENVKIMESIAESLDLVRSQRDGGDGDETPPPSVASGRRATLGDAQRQVTASGRNDRPGPVHVGRSLVSSAGQPISSEEALHKQFADVLNDRRGLAPDVMSVVAAAHYNFPESRRLDNDGWATTKKLDAIVGEDVLVASGGICAPVNVDYSVFTIGTNDRPLRDGLPQFQADRGGITFVLPPTLASAAAGVGIWTAATDANPGGATKPRVTLQCGATQTVTVDAITERALVGNLMSRFAPEQVAALLNNLDINFARTAELNLLTKISANSTAVSASQLLGATRDLLPTIDLAVAAYRYRNRVPRTLQLTAIFPDWAKDLVRADLAREQANSDPLAVTDAQINDYFSARNLSVIWLLDGLAANGSGVPYAFQGFGTQNANTALLDWPHTLTWWLFAPGTFVYLNGGSLNVGVVRDSTLNSTNDYEIFEETFESIAYRGLASLQITSTVRPNGASAAPLSTASY